MNDRNIDEPVIPQTARFEPGKGYQFDGLSIRDYFAANAPAVPDWWPESKWVMDYPSRLTADWPAAKMDEYRCWGDCLEDDGVNPEWLAEFKAMREKVKGLDARNEAGRLAAHMARETAWRWHYAGAMLAERAK